jgi:ABC-type transporter Mla subunit MlaD
MTIEEVPPITAIQRVEELIGYLDHIVKEDKVALDDMIANAPSTLRDDATEEQLEELIEDMEEIIKHTIRQRGELIELLNQAEQQVRKIQEHTRLGLGILKNGDGE